jgi:hypothetical protein
MNELFSASAALASLLGLAFWAGAVPTRAWGDGAPANHRRAVAVALGTLALQSATAVAAAGMAAGLALVLAAWMVLGWLLVLAMSQWPAASRLWARRLGAAGCVGCVLALAWPLLRLVMS